MVSGGQHYIFMGRGSVIFLCYTSQNPVTVLGEDIQNRPMNISMATRLVQENRRKNGRCALSLFIAAICVSHWLWEINITTRYIKSYCSCLHSFPSDIDQRLAEVWWVISVSMSFMFCGNDSFLSISSLCNILVVYFCSMFFIYIIRISCKYQLNRSRMLWKLAIEKNISLFWLKLHQSTNRSMSGA